MYDLTSDLLFLPWKEYTRKSFSTKYIFYSTKMSVSCYLQNIVRMVSDAPTHSKP